jgi:hypothetical protein
MPNGVYEIHANLLYMVDILRPHHFDVGICVSRHAPIFFFGNKT